MDGPFRRTIDAAKKYVVSSALERVDWNAEFVRGDLGPAIQQLKQEPGQGLSVGGVTLPLALAELGLIDEYEPGGPPPADRPRSEVVRRPLKACRLEAYQPAGVCLGSGGYAVRAKKVTERFPPELPEAFLSSWRAWPDVMAVAGGQSFG